MKYMQIAISIFLLLQLPIATLSQSSSPVQIPSRIGAPLIQDGRIYFGTEAGIFYAFDMETGEEIWRFSANRANFLPPAIYENLIYVGGQDGYLRALDLETGIEQWAFEAGRVEWNFRDKFINGTPTIANGTLYFSSEDFNVYAINALTGEEIWRFHLDEEPQAMEIPLVDGRLYIGSWDGYLYAIDAESGNEIWRSQTDNDHIGRTIRSGNGHLWVSDDSNGELNSNQAPYVTAVPVITDSSIYFANWAGELLAVDVATGEQLWRFRPDTENIRHAGPNFYIAMHEDTVYFETGEDMHIYGVDRHSGELVFEHIFENPLFHFGEADGIGLFGELILSPSGNITGIDLHALDLSTRQFVWHVSNLMAGLPAIIDGVVYFGGIDQTLHGVDLLTGEEVWRLE